MNLNEQLQQAYEDGRRQALSESLDIPYGTDFQNYQYQSRKDGTQVGYDSEGNPVLQYDGKTLLFHDGAGWRRWTTGRSGYGLKR